MGRRRILRSHPAMSIFTRLNFPEGTLFNWVYCDPGYHIEASVDRKGRDGSAQRELFSKEPSDVKTFPFSKAMREYRNQQGKWMESNLAPFIKDPEKTVLKTKMKFKGVLDEHDRDDIIAYLKVATTDMHVARFGLGRFGSDADTDSCIPGPRADAAVPTVGRALPRGRI